MKRSRRMRGAVPVLLAMVLWGAGCASYSQHALPVREPLQRGDFAAAQAFLQDKKPGGDGLPYLMELGLVLRYEAKYDSSNAVFDSAEQLVDELYTKSISRELGAFLTNDEMIAYDGEMWERALVNYYRALNYIDLGNYDGALVECRKLNQKLGTYVDATGESSTYRTDAFAQYLTAILYEVGGETADAWVSLRLADEAYDHYREAYGTPAPKSLQRDLIRLARAQGFRDDEERFREKYPDAETIDTADMLEYGEVVLFWEEGFIPAKIQHDATVPILKGTGEWEGDREKWAHSLQYRWAHPRPYEKQKLRYLLRFALPAYPPPLPTERPGWCQLTAAGTSASARSEVGENLAAIARKGLDDRMGNIVFRAILRALTKWAATASVENNQGDVAGKLVNFLTAAAEKADTRSWITLPNAIHVTRLLVPPGTHDLELTCHDA
ncbi:hypothetical protein K8I85_14390, partial [bacterium]|nr:hypothetical protein [bacterium]